MSPSEQPEVYMLTLLCPAEQASVVLYNGYDEEVGRSSFGEDLIGQFPKGLYKARVLFDGAVKDHRVQLNRDLELRLVAPPRTSVIPLRDATDGSDFFADAAHMYSKVCTRQGQDGDASILVFLRLRGDAVQAENWGWRFALLDARGVTICTMTEENTAGHCDGEGDEAVGFLALSMKSPAGSYFLEVRIDDADTRRIFPLYLLSGYQLRLFLSIWETPLFSDMRILWAPEDEAFNDGNEWMRASDILLNQLQNGGFSHALSAEDLNSLVPSPAMWLASLHFALGQTKGAPPLGLAGFSFAAFPDDMPDAMILDLQIRQQLGQPIPKAISFVQPPMLLEGYFQLLQASRAAPSLIGKLWIEKLHRTLQTDSLWTSWEIEQDLYSWLQGAIKKSIGGTRMNNLQTGILDLIEQQILTHQRNFAQPLAPNKGLLVARLGVNESLLNTAIDEFDQLAKKEKAGLATRWPNTWEALQQPVQLSRALRYFIDSAPQPVAYTKSLAPNEKLEMKDMVVILPGIMGSVLEKGGKTLWSPSGRALWNFVTSLGDSIKQLKLEDPNADDGVEATALLEGGVVVPKLFKFDGYEKFRAFLKDSFAFTPTESGQYANLFDFPYDWRRDNRRNAKKLQTFVEEKLTAWRAYDGGRFSEAKVIFVCHSMGGLVARYYTEVLGGWKTCRAVFTFGTPHRGAVGALDTLVNGVAGMDMLTELVRSFPSVYQLLPRYKVVFDGNADQFILDLPDLEALSLDLTMVHDAWDFHEEIENAVNANRKLVDVLNDAGEIIESYSKLYRVIPFAGTRQPTLQSATLTESGLEVSYEPPMASPDNILLGHGDGTVPTISAIPIEFTNNEQNVPELHRVSYDVARHAFLQSHEGILEDLYGKFSSFIQERSLRDFKAIFGKPITLFVEDTYVAGKPIVIECRGDGASLTHPPTLFITPRDQGRASVASGLQMEKIDEVWSAHIADLYCGLYQIELQPAPEDRGKFSPQQDLFEVLPEEVAKSTGPPVASRKGHILVGYAKEDEEQAQALALWLKVEARQSVWFAPWNLRDDKPRAIQFGRALAGADAVLLCLGNHELGKWQEDALKRAIAKRPPEHPLTIGTAFLSGRKDDAPALPSFVDKGNVVQLAEDASQYGSVLSKLIKLDLSGGALAAFVSEQQELVKLTPLSPEEGFAKGHALVVGVAGYIGVNPLPSTVLNDAKAFAEKLISDGCGYAPGRVKLLLDREATKKAILDEFDRLSRETREDDTVTIFFSGHGANEETHDQAGQYLLPYDCVFGELAKTSISGDDLTQKFRAIKASKLLVLFDCCHSGGLGIPKSADPSKRSFQKGLSPEYYKKLADARDGRVILSSSRADEVSYVFDNDNNSAFTIFLLEALDGKGTHIDDGFVRVLDLFRHTSEMVPAKTSGKQHPVFKSHIEEDFPVALLAETVPSLPSQPENGEKQPDQKGDGLDTSEDRDNNTSPLSGADKGGEMTGNKKQTKGRMFDEEWMTPDELDTWDLPSLVIEAGLGFDALLAGIPRGFKAQIARPGPLNEDLRLLVEQLNAKEHLADKHKTIPLKVWLRNAERLSDPQMVSLKFKEILETLFGAE